MEDSLDKLSKVEHIFLTELFERMCPYYMAMGMTYEQFWREDVTMPIMFRRAYRIKQEEMKWNIWEGGVYTYEALCKVSPVLHAFSKSGTKPLPFSEKPHGIEKLEEKILENNVYEEKEIKEKREQLIENERLRAQIYFNNWYKATKKHFEQKEGEK